jgi:hypothetical protein
MKRNLNTAILALGFIAGQSLFGIQAASADTYQASVTKQHPGKVKTFFQKHDAVRKATIGAGVGTAAGAVTGLISGKGMVKGAVIGAGTGATVGAINSSKILAKHPIMRDMATGATAGTGLALSASKGRGTGKRALTGAALGTALGMGAGLLKDKLK